MDKTEFNKQMDFLAKDEQEAIDGYDKVIGMIEDPNVKEQLEKIKKEEIAHKAFLEKVKQDQNLEYTEPLDEEYNKEATEWLQKKMKETGKSAEELSSSDEFKEVVKKSITAKKQESNESQESNKNESLTLYVPDYINLDEDLNEYQLMQILDENGYTTTDEDVDLLIESIENGTVVLEIKK